MKKRNHIQIAIDALKKQRSKYSTEVQKAVEIMSGALKNKEFFEAEIKKLDAQIKGLEGDPEEKKALEEVKEFDLT